MKHFCVFAFLAKVKMAAIFGKKKLSWKLGAVYCLDNLWVENSTKSLYLKRLKRYKHFCVFAFLAKIRKFKMATIFENTLKSCYIHFLNTLGVENFDEIALSLTIKEIQAFLCFRIFGQNSKIQNGRHFWKEENFLKIGRSV